MSEACLASRVADSPPLVSRAFDEPDLEIEDEVAVVLLTASEAAAVDEAGPDDNDFGVDVL